MSKEKPVLAIHRTPESYSDRWEQYCQEHGVEYFCVDAYSLDACQQLAEADALLWHWNNREPASLLVAPAIIRAAEAQGLLVYPNTATCWHYDDKIAQNYLLNAIGAPFVASHVFYNEKAALEWISTATWPQVFKLSGGSGSRMVRKVSSAAEARELCRTSFGAGFMPAEALLNDASIKLKKSFSSVEGGKRFMRKLPRALGNWRQRRRMPRVRGYFYVQEFLPGNESDTRITIVGERAFAFRRLVRPGDFRASGSGRIDYDLSQIDPRCIEIAFQVARRLGTQSMAFDFVFDPQGEPKIVEISYAFQDLAIHNCPGHYVGSVENWQEGQVWPQDAIIEDLLAALANRQPEQVAPGEAP